MLARSLIKSIRPPIDLSSSWILKLSLAGDCQPDQSTIKISSKMGSVVQSRRSSTKAPYVVPLSYLSMIGNVIEGYKDQRSSVRSSFGGEKSAMRLEPKVIIARELEKICLG